MAELKINKDEVVGIRKEVDSGAWDLLFSAVQEDIYMYPKRSFVRETISNALDAIEERRIAKNILLLGEPVEKYYLQRTDDQLLKDSSFDANYYDKVELAKEVDQKVQVFYEKGRDRDQIFIEDKGVGLGGERLKGFMRLGYSSKRNMKDLLGKFGMGAKSGLATGVEFFTMTTVYNGYTTTFMIYRKDYDPITPKSIPGFKELWDVTMADGTEKIKTIYWQATDKPNGVTITLSVKKHNRDAFVNAVTQQFSYFDNKIQFKYPFKHVEGYNTIVLKSDPLYESDRIVIPKESIYSTPHIVLDGLNYGQINYPELELENRLGAIGIKAKMSEVDINQSRESLKYSDKTREVIVKALEIAKQEAAAYVASTTAKTSNIFTTINNALKSSKISSDQVTYQFSLFLDTTDISGILDLTEIGYKQFRLTEDNFKVLFHTFQVYEIELTESHGAVTSIRDKIKGFRQLANKPIVYSEDASLGIKKTGIICDELEVSTFVYIRPKTVDNWSKKVKDYMVKQLQNNADILLDQRDFEFEEEEQEEGEATIKPTRKTLAQMRKENQEVLYTEYDYEMMNTNTRWNTVKILNWERNKHTIKIKDIDNDFEGAVFTTDKYKELARILGTVDTVPGGAKPIVYHVAESVLHHFLPYGIFITDYFKKYNPVTKEIMLGEALKKLNTIRRIKKLTKVYDLSNNKGVIEALAVFDDNKFFKYKNAYGKNTLKQALNGVNGKVVDDVLEYMDRLAEAQTIIAEYPADIAAEKTKKLLGGEILKVDAYDVEFYNQVKLELERLNPLEDILKHSRIEHLGDEDILKFTTLVNKILSLIN